MTDQIAALHAVADPLVRLAAARDAIATHRAQAELHAKQRDAMIYAGIDQFEVKWAPAGTLRCLCRDDNDPRRLCPRKHDRNDMCRPHWRLELLGIKTWQELGMPHEPRSHAREPWRDNALEISGIHNGTFQRAEAYRADPPEGETGYWQQRASKRRQSELVRLPDPPARYETPKKHWEATGQIQVARMAELAVVDKIRSEVRNPLIRELRGTMPDTALAELAGVPRPELYSIAPRES